MAAEYDTFVHSLSELKQGEEIELIIRDTETYDSRRVSAIVSSTRQKLPDGDTLWIRYVLGLRHKEPWVIKITKELGSLIKD